MKEISQKKPGRNMATLWNLCLERGRPLDVDLLTKLGKIDMLFLNPLDTLNISWGLDPVRSVM